MATTTFINDMLDGAFTGTITMGLFKSGGTELSGGSYARQTVTLAAAADKIKQTSTNVVFSDLPTGSSNAIVSWKVFQDGVEIDSNTLSSPFTADISNNELELSYRFDLSGA